MVRSIKAHSPAEDVACGGAACHAAHRLADGCISFAGRSLAWRRFGRSRLRLQYRADRYTHAGRERRFHQRRSLWQYREASATQPQFVHLAYPIGLEQWAEGRTYDIQWRTQDYTNSVTIELHHGSQTGPLELTIGSGIPNSGSLLWTVPPGGLITPAADYVVVVRRDDDGTVGESRLPLEVVVIDTVPPTVLDATPRIVETQQQINTPITSISLTFSEALDPLSASDAANYELRGAGLDAAFFTADDSLFPVTPTYLPGLHDGAPSLVVLDIGAGGLPGDEFYQLTAYNSITDLGRNPLAADGFPQRLRAASSPLTSPIRR